MGALPTAETAAQKLYVLRSLLPCRLRRKFVETPKDSARHSLTMLVLSVMVAQGENDTISEGAAPTTRGSHCTTRTLQLPFQA